MIQDIKVVLGGKEFICTVKELKAFQKELNELFPTETRADTLNGLYPLKDYPRNQLREFYQGRAGLLPTGFGFSRNGISL